MYVFTARVCAFLLGILLGVEFLGHRIRMYPWYCHVVFFPSNFSMSLFMAGHFPVSCLIDLC